MRGLAPVSRPFLLVAIASALLVLWFSEGWILALAGFVFNIGFHQIVVVAYWLGRGLGL